MRFNGAQLALSLAASAQATETYDYIIAGGGAAGLVVANRLSEDGKKSVLVLEAGPAHLDDPSITIPGYLGSTIGKPDYDWMYKTVPQTYANNRSMLWSRGKGLGGSGLINFMAYGRPSKGEYDAFETLGNKGWNWNSLLKYIKKSETFQTPSKVDGAIQNFTYDSSSHGSSGPIKNSFSSFVSEAQKPWTSALNALGLPTVLDPESGDNNGAWYSVANIDNTTKRRSYSADAYYQPFASRRNLRVLTNAFVSRALIPTASRGNSALATATGVEYFLNGTRQVAQLSPGGEVILSAGALASPKILELSGIGNATLLRSHGIDVKVDLPGVGEGILEHVYLGASYEVKNSSIITLDDLKDPAYLAKAKAEYDAKKTGIMTIGVTAFAYTGLQTVTNSSYAAGLIARQALKVKSQSDPAVKKLQSIQLGQLTKPSVYGLIEFVAFPGFFTTKSTGQPRKKYLTFTVSLQFPWSRGSIHVTSSDVNTPAAMDPRYFSDPFDLEVMLAGLKFTRKLARTGDFASVLGQEADPGPSAQTDADLIEYIKDYVGTEYHTVASTKMRPLEDGGVVSPELRVYGTSNIRVVDLGILPIHISAHPQSTVFGLAEKASDIIRGITTI